VSRKARRPAAPPPGSGDGAVFVTVAAPATGTDPSAPPAHALLLACARAAFDAAGAAPARGDALARGVDWNAFLALAERNRLLPLVHRALEGVDDVPETVRSRLRAAFAANARHALALAGELRGLMDAMDGLQVRALAYKGPALAVRAYGHLALRTYSDLDLLVAPADCVYAAGMLYGRGYRCPYRFSVAQDAAFVRVDGDYPFHHPETGELVELHVRVSSTRFCVDLPTERLMARARPVPIGGGDVLAPADDDLFLALCVHGAKHRWARLEWLACAAALRVRGALDPGALLDRSVEIGAGRTVLLALLLMRDAFDLPLPADAGQSVSIDPGLRALADEARALWFAENADEGETTPANLRFNARLRDGAADRARYAARWLFAPSPEDWAWVRLPDALAPLYRVLRPLRLAVRYRPGRRP
jgi:hypothetical protein